MANEESALSRYQAALELSRKNPGTVDRISLLALELAASLEQKGINGGDLAEALNAFLDQYPKEVVNEDNSEYHPNEVVNDDDSEY